MNCSTRTWWIATAHCRSARRSNRHSVEEPGQRLVSLTRCLHHLIVAKRIVVVQIFVARRHRVHPLAHHRHHFVANLRALALVTERTRHLRGQAQFAVHLAQ